MGSTENDIYVMIITVTAVLLILLIFIVSFLFIYKNRQVKHLLEIESMKKRYTQEILKSELEIKEQTLKKISEEIHDNVGQVLSLAVLNLSAIEPSDTAKTSVKVEKTTKLVEKAISDLRHLSKTLDAENITSLGLTAIIKSELDLLEKTGMYHTALNVSGEERRLNGHEELILYRIIQESLNNIIKHARAKRIAVSLAFLPQKINIDISDNGVGFSDIPGMKNNIYETGAGLKNMKKRAGLIGADFSISSKAGSGTNINISLPTNNQ